MNSINSSQLHRKGATVSPSVNQRVKSLLERASDLEHQLSNLAGKSNEEKAARLRSHLCEVLSDVLISDPATGHSQDCTGRLWRSCFYAPILIWRKKISREKKKQSNPKTLKSLEQNFKKFLGEAVTLYDYLTVQYQSKLVSCLGDEDKATLTAPTQDSATQESRVSTVTSLEGVVPGLFRLYIYMGDLFRYAETFPKAEACYLNASKLGPGMGNPYNQLAVVSQMKDPNMSCVALYFYCRSLLATHDSFETSGSNLDRLFNLNRTYLEEHCRSPVPPILESTGKHNTKKGASNSSAELPRAQKAAASRACLAHFVDLHCDLFRGANTASLQRKVDGILQSLDSLLAASAFGDSLLIKMVLISVFAAEKAKNTQGEVDKAARDFVFRFGTSLGQKLEAVLSKLVKSENSSSTSSIRVLVPFLILCEYAVRRWEGVSESTATDFGQTLVSVANHITSYINGKSMPPSMNPPKLNEAPPGRNFKLLRGYQPYNFLFESFTTEGPFIDAMEAVDVLDVNMTQGPQTSSSQQQQQQPSQSQANNKNHSVDPNEESFAILVKCLVLCEHSVANPESPIAVVNGKYALQAAAAATAAATTAEQMDVDDDAPNSTLDDVKDMEDEAGDVVLFNSSPPAADTLPMPNESNTVPTVIADAQQETANSIATLAPPASALPPPPPVVVAATLPPPPGFGGPQPALAPMGGQIPAFYAPLQATPIQAVPAYNHFPPMVPGLAAPAAIGESINMFGGNFAMQTANPFAAQDMAQWQSSGLYGPGISGAGESANSHAVDVSSFLDSTLLDSLWMKEPSSVRETRNPFAR